MSDIAIATETPKSSKHKAAPMSAADFDAFVTFMMIRSDWSARKLSDALGVSENTMTAWRRNGAPRHVGLACGAIAYGLPAWRRPCAL